MEGDISVIQLRQFGIPLEPTVTPVDFTPELLYRTVLSALPRIGAIDAKKRNATFPSSLPSDPTGRLTLFSTMVTYLQNSGCAAAKHEHLMYPTESTTKPLLSWLVAELHRAAEEAAAVDDDASDDGDDETQSRLSNSLAQLTRALRNCSAQQKGKASHPLLGARDRLVVLRRAARRGSRLETVPVCTVPVATWVDEDGATTATLVEQGERAHAAMEKHSIVKDNSTERVRIGEKLLLSLQECAAVHRTFEKKFQTLVSQRLSDSDGSTLYGHAWSHNWRAGRGAQASSSSATAASSSLSLKSRFFNPAEDGLLDGDPMLVRIQAQQREREKAEMDALEEAMERKRAQAEAQVSQREEEERNVQERLTAAKKEIRAKKNQLKVMEEEQARLAEEQQRLAEETAAQLALIKEREQQAASEEQLLSLMDDPEGSEARIRAELEELQAKRTAYREELQEKLQKIEKKKEELLEELAEAGGNREEQLANLRAAIKAIKRSIKEKHRDLKQLRREVSTAPKNIDRTQFLTYIMEMTTNVIKQQRQIDDVIFDIEECNVSIDSVAERLRQYYNELEKKVYDAATANGNVTFALPVQFSTSATGAKSVAAAAAENSNNGNAAKGKAPSKDAVEDAAYYQKVYKALVDMRDVYLSLVTLIEERGAVKLELREASEHIRKLQTELEAHNIEKVKSDLAAMEEANEELLRKIREANTSGQNNDNDDEE